MSIKCRENAEDAGNPSNWRNERKTCSRGVTIRVFGFLLVFVSQAVSALQQLSSDLERGIIVHAGCSFYSGGIWALHDATVFLLYLDATVFIWFHLANLQSHWWIKNIHCCSFVFFFFLFQIFPPRSNNRWEWNQTNLKTRKTTKMRFLRHTPSM